MPMGSCYLFHGVPAAKLAALEGLARSQSLPAGAWLYHKSQPAERIYLVLEGAVELVMPVENRFELPVALIRPADGCLGVGSLVEPYRHTLSARCKEASRLWVIRAEDLRRLFEADPELGRTVMTNLAKRLLERLVETREEVRIHFLNLIQAVSF